MGANLANDNDLRALAEQVNAAFEKAGTHGWRAAPLGFPFEAAADFSYGIDVAEAIPGIGALRRPGGREDRHAGARPAPLPPRDSRSLWSRLASLFDDRKG